MAGGDTSFKLVGTVGALAAQAAAKKVMTSGWKLATGNPPPANPEDPEVSWGEAVAFAVASGAIVGVARLIVTRKIASYWARSTGTTPENVNEVT
jgi:hypothetical protein